MSSIVLTGGGTAGHCIPHLAILPKIHEAFDNISYIGSANGIEKKLMSEKCDYYEISTVKYSRSLSPKNLLIPFILLKSVREAKKILKKIKPSVVFSKGGYVSLPVILAASKLKIPVVTHESDFSLGLTNKLTAKKCDKVLTTFPDTAMTISNGVFCGSPIREELFYVNKTLAKQKFGFSLNRKTLLILGGSSGSKKINNTVNEIIDKLLENYNVLHICGKNNLPENVKKDNYKCFDFVLDMASVYAACDFAVSRCGSNSACELIALKIPTLFIPLSKSASRGDQIENANHFQKKGMCLTLDELELNALTLLTKIKKLENDAGRIIAKIAENNFYIGNNKICDILTKYK